MDVLLLGPVEARLDDRPIELGPRKQRAVLAMLALQVDRPVSADRLAEGLWGEERPASAAKNVQLYVSRLRRLFAGNGAEIVTRGHGYELRLAGGEVDAVRVERLIEAARAREALGAWRGEPLCDLADQPFAAAEIRRLEELRLRAAELAIDADLAAGRDVAVLGELEALLAKEPLRERLQAQRMLALYRSGRQGDALEAYRTARAALVEEIGVEPGPELRRLHDAILRQDASLLPADIELPPELDTRTPLTGRDRELDWLRQHWRRARDGAGGLVLVTGAAGIGKTRLVAELADEVLGERGAVTYAVGVPEDFVAAASAARRPTLLVLDDVDRATAAQRAALASFADWRTLPVLIVATAAGADGLPAEDTLSLAPLEASAVRTLALRYADARVDVPVERLLAVSGGIPERLHAVTAEWAQGLAARRAGEAAKRIAAERPVLRAAEDELAGTVVELQAARQRGDAGVSGDLVVCPYKGLACFDVEDAPFFAGRERLVAELVARLTGAPLTGIVGASGSGKSSALRAGLLAALAAGVLPGSERWEHALLRPGAHPMQALEQASSGTTPHGRPVIAVDQFEEVFTACRSSDERAAFVDALVACTRDPRRRALVLIAVRADFYGRCAAHPELARLLGANHVLVGPMRRDELRRAIELPARRAGLHVEPNVADALIADVDGEPGGLPLLSAALVELWQHRDGRALRLVDYERAGGVHGAVARLAERAYERLDTDQQHVARRILMRLAGDGEGDAMVRRRVPLAEVGVAADERDGVATVLAVLAGDRLVTIGDGDVEVAHEALLREWPRLRGWLEEDAQGRRLHRHLTHASRDWLTAGREPAELYRGARLAAALDWIETHEQELNELEREFLAQSRSQADAESERQRRANRRLRALLAGLAVLLALALVAGAVAVYQRGQARDAALTADAQRLGAMALTRERLENALVLARAGVALEDSAVTRSNLLSVLMRQPQALGMLLPEDGQPLFAAAVSPDERHAAVGGMSGTVTIVELPSRRPVGRPYEFRGGIVQDLRFSPDGRTLAVSGNAPPSARGVVDLIDPRTQERRVRIVPPRYPGPTPFLMANTRFLPNGRDVIVQQIPDLLDVDGALSVMRRFDGETGAAMGPALRVGRHSSIGMWGTGDRSRLFVTSPADDETSMIDSERLELLQRWPAGDVAGTVSSDGRTFALGSQEGEVRLLDLRSGRVRRLDGSHDGAVVRMSFTRDGRTLVTSGADGMLIVWDLRAGEVRETLSGHANGAIWGLDVSADGRTAYSAGEYGRSFVWDLAGDRRLVRPFAADQPFIPDDGDTLPRGLALSPDGRTLAVGNSDGAVDLIDAATLRPQASLPALRGFVAALAFSPDGRVLAAAGQHGEVTLFDARTLRPRGALTGLRTTTQTVAFSPDSRLLAAAELGDLPATGDPADYTGGGVRVWDVRRRALTGVRFRSSSPSIAFSPDGAVLAAASMTTPTQIRDTQSGRLVTQLSTPDLGRSVAFSRAGDLLATGHFDGTGQLWSTETWKPVGRPLEGHDGERLLWIEFSPDGSTLATAGLDGTVGLWDVATQTPIGRPLTIEPETFLAADLSPDGSRLFSVSTGRRAVRWDVSPDAWKRHACRVAGRELTQREWRDALPDRPYRSVCRAG